MHNYSPIVSMHNFKKFIHTKNGDNMERPEYFNQRIDCDVTNCKYYDAYNNKCALGRISVSEKNAICMNYEKKELE